MVYSLTAKELCALLEPYPQFLRAADLVKLGLFRGRSDVSVAKREGRLPPYISFSSHYHVFPKSSIIAWLLEKYNEVPR